MGGIDVSKAYLGGTELASLNVGDKKVWPTGPAVVADSVEVSDGPSSDAFAKSITAGLTVPLAGGARNGKVFFSDVANAKTVVIDDKSSSVDVTLTHVVTHLNSGVMQIAVTNDNIYFSGTGTAAISLKNVHPTYPFVTAYATGGYGMCEIGPYIVVTPRPGVADVYDKSSAALVKSVPISGATYVTSAVAVSDKAYILQSTTAKAVVDVVDLVKLTHLKTVELNPAATASKKGTPQQSCAGANNKVYFSGDTDNCVYEYDVTTDAVTRTFAVGDECNGVAVSKTKLYASCEHTNQVAVFSLSSGSLLNKIPVGAGPRHIALSGTHAYVACSGAARIDVIG